MRTLTQSRLHIILNGIQHTISVVEAATLLDLPQKETAKLLARWTGKGWLLRIKRGLYALASFNECSSDFGEKNQWALAEKLYSPCYIGALSAAQYWGLTKQILSTISVLTIQKPRNHNLVINESHFSLRIISQQAMFGLRPVWHEQIKVLVSDPTRTILDFLVDPKLGGGIGNVTDMFINYLKSEHKNLMLLFDYSRRLCNGAVFKRLGYLLERYEPMEVGIIGGCKIRIPSGYIKLNPQLSADKLITRWGLWV
jgi:predicted transcriptional regulator of viral defense system